MIFQPPYSYRTPDTDIPHYLRGDPRIGWSFDFGWPFSASWAWPPRHITISTQLSTRWVTSR